MKMNKKEFLNELEKRISVLKPEEIRNTMEFYEEYFEDAGAENEEKVIEELGDIAKLAEEVIAMHKKSYTSENAELVKQVNTNDVQAIELELQNASVEISASYADEIDYKIEHIADEDISVSVENNKLIIEEKMGIFASKKNFMNFFKAFNMNSSLNECTKRKIHIFVPAKLQLEKIDFYSQVGSLNIKDVNAKEFQARTNCGNFNLKNVQSECLNLNTKAGTVSVYDCQAKTVKADSAAGSIKFVNMKPENIKLNSGAGSIFIENIESDEALVYTGAGSIKVLTCDFKELKANSGAGTVEIRDTKSNSGKFNTGAGAVIIENCDCTNSKINSGMGYIKLTGKFHQDTFINTSMGKVDLSLQDDLDNYSIKLRGSLERVYVNDSLLKNSYDCDMNSNRAEIGNSDSENKIKISSSMGKINIRDNQ